MIFQRVRRLLDIDYDAPFMTDSHWALITFRWMVSWYRLGLADEPIGAREVFPSPR